MFINVSIDIAISFSYQSLRSYRDRKIQRSSPQRYVTEDERYRDTDCRNKGAPRIQEFHFIFITTRGSGNFLFVSEPCRVPCTNAQKRKEACPEREGACKHKVVFRNHSMSARFLPNLFSRLRPPASLSLYRKPSRADRFRVRVRVRVIGLKSLGEIYCGDFSGETLLVCEQILYILYLCNYRSNLRVGQAGPHTRVITVSIQICMFQRL